MTYEDQRQGPPGMVCRACKAETDRDVLSAFGAMCGPCYRDYCAQPLAKSPDVGDKRKAGPMAWAPALKRREEQRAPLTPFQRQAWRDALGGRPTTATDEAFDA